MRRCFGLCAACLLLAALFLLTRRSDDAPLAPAESPAVRTMPQPSTAEPSSVHDATPRVPVPEFTAFGPTATTLEDATRDVVPEALPLATMLWAVAARRLDVLSQQYSPPHVQRLAKEGWGSYGNQLDALFLKHIGPYEARSYRFEFHGDAERGKVVLVQGGRTLPGMRVVRIEGRWLIDER